MLLILPAVVLSAPIIAGAPPASPVVFAYGGGFDGYETWDWSTITHIGFWTPPSDDVKAVAKKHDVRLFHTCTTADPDHWTDSHKRQQLTQACVDDVKAHGYDGVFFDFEGNQLSSDQQKGYVRYAQETTDALRPLNASLFVNVGGRPSYELRNYDYIGLAGASDFLFIMGYDMHFYDDYTCMKTSEGNVCSPAEASIRSLTAGVEEYLKAGVPAEKLVLGLPWYGQRYKQIVAPINEGQINFKDVVKAFDDGRVTDQSHDKDSLSKIIKCKGDCLPGKGGDKVWYDDAETLAPKFALAGKNHLRGVGIWEADKLPTEDKHADLCKAMWAAVKGWQDDADAPAPVPATGDEGDEGLERVGKVCVYATNCHGRCAWTPSKTACANNKVCEDAYPQPRYAATMCIHLDGANASAAANATEVEPFVDWKH